MFVAATDKMRLSMCSVVLGTTSYCETLHVYTKLLTPMLRCRVYNWMPYCMATEFFSHGQNRKGGDRNDQTVKMIVSRATL